ncbi:F0F1 ATP synthase subunit delta [Demequina aurantiaca]|uniref:F0F1 ATP synthase subunit delta n=1 Tax=Demequina aurantiaca TaxID=676200 RepID=UPI000785A9BE|nr:F0F1 ATP synthase subunit delta [Demequina aurantiaca]
MRGTSQASHDAVLRGFELVLSASGKDGLSIGDQLFAVVDTLDSSGSLRRSLTDPARPGADKGAMVTSLFGKFDTRVQDVLVEFVNARWSEEQDLAESIEDAGVAAVLAYAESTGKLVDVEDQLFRVERILSDERDLLVAMSNRSATKEARLALFEGVLGGKLLPVTQSLLNRAVGMPRGRRLVPAIEAFIASAAERRNRSVAHVTAAVELSAAQRKRLADILTGAYGREVQINVAVDPEVIGGIRVQVGSEVVDGTVLARLDQARRRLVG